MTTINRKSRGQSMLEFGLILPILLMMILMVLDLGRFLFAYSSLTNAVREGARYGIINPSDGLGIQTTVKDFSVGLYRDDVVVTSGETTPNFITVSATYTFRPITPVAVLLAGSNAFVISSESTMHIEGAGY